MIHYSSKFYHHIAPMSFNDDSVEYISYGGIRVMDLIQCDCNQTKDHTEIIDVIHNQTKWPRLIRFISSYRPFKWFYNGTIHKVSHDEWLNNIDNVEKCTCCDR